MWPFFIPMRPLVGPASASILCVWVIPVLPRAGVLINKHFRQRRLGFRNGEVRSGFSRREARNKGGTTMGRRCLALRDRGFMAGRGRVSRCCLPPEARGLESRSPFCGARSGALSSDVSAGHTNLADPPTKNIYSLLNSVFCNSRVTS